MTHEDRADCTYSEDNDDRPNSGIPQAGASLIDSKVLK